MTFMADARRALDLAGPHAVLYGRSAARLVGLEHDDPEVIDVLVPWVPRDVDIPGVRVRRTRGTGRLAPVLKPLPHTDIVDTVLDLADRTDVGTCIYWFTEATRRGLVTVESLTAGLDGRRRHRHRALIDDIAEDLASGVTSNLEVRYARGVERAHDLPRSERQFIVPETGHRADFGYPEASLLIETDGLAYHAGAQADRDRSLDAAHAHAGWRTVRYTWAQVVGAPCVVAREVAAILRAAGRDVDARPCAAERNEGGTTAAPFGDSRC